MEEKISKQNIDRLNISDNSIKLDNYAKKAKTI